MATSKKSETPIAVEPEVETPIAVEPEKMVASYIKKCKNGDSLKEVLSKIPQTLESSTHLRQLSGLVQKALVGVNAKVVGDEHLLLGKNYYNDDAKQLHYGLDDLSLIVEK